MTLEGEVERWGPRKSRKWNKGKRALKVEKILLPREILGRSARRRRTAK